MKVQKIKLQNSIQPHWIVIGDDYLPIEPIGQYLYYLYSIKKSPYTIRTYAHHLKIYWEYLIAKKLNWKEINTNTIANFIATMSGLVDGNIIHLALEQSKRSERTINQIIIAVSSFYQYHLGLNNVEEIAFYSWKKPFYTSQSYKPLLHHLSKSKNQRHSIFKLREKKNLCKVIDPTTIKMMVAACKRVRDKFLICLLYETGCRIGQVLGLRHADIETFNNIIKIFPRNDNANFARSKSCDENIIHVSDGLMQLYCDYFMQEYGEVESDYVFINLWEGEIGKPISYSSVITLFQRLSKKLGTHVTPHMLRHTHATELIKAGWGMAHVQQRLGHRNIQTTINTYVHLSNDDLKEKYKAYLMAKEEN
ncbi:MAG: tyrosine-type recombinase/integrase [Legionellaceae bacterium]|nr:tyrosine-type recombinase/integrase [Legionellaceae bacterium]